MFFYDFDNTPVDIARGFDCDLEKKYQKWISKDS